MTSPTIAVAAALLTLVGCCVADWAAPRAVIDLSAKPQLRWAPAFDALWRVAPHSCKETVLAFISMVSAFFQTRGCNDACVDQLAAIVDRKFPGILDEALGITDQLLVRTGLNVSAEFIVACSFVYELSHTTRSLSSPVRGADDFAMGCTSFVACSQRSNEPIFGRNLDWSNAELFRNITVELDWKGSSKPFSSPHFLLDLGMMTGVRPGGFAISLNSRAGTRPLADLITCASDPNTFAPLSLSIRKLLEGRAATFDDVVNTVTKAHFCTPAYITVAGPVADQGVVLTKTTTPGQVLNPRWLNCTEDSGWFVVQTNYDWPYSPARDDRLGLAIDKLVALGRVEATTSDGIFEVLSVPGNASTAGVLNQGTVFSAVMRPQQGAQPRLLTTVRSFFAQAKPF
jgi:hypothetical protein